MDAGQLINAFSASLFALLGIWAAVVRRHWFLRFAVVGGVLGLALLIPAYEVVIEFGVAMALIALGVWLARGRPAWRMRLSLETALLAMVVAAVAAAIVGAAPTYGVESWIRLVGIGITVSYFALVCLWMVCGRARLTVRFFGGIAAIIAFVVVMYVGEGVLYASGQSLNQPSDSGAFAAAIGRWFQPDYTASWMGNIVPVVGAGVGLMLLVIAAARASGWFTNVDGRGRRELGWAARAVMCLLVTAVAAPNLYLFYRLCMPPALPCEPPPADNAFDDLMTAGRLASRELEGVEFKDVSVWSDAELNELTVRLTPVYERIDDALKRPSWATTVYGDANEMAVIHENGFSTALADAIRLKELRQQERFGDLARACCRSIRLGQSLIRGQRAGYDLHGFSEGIAMMHLQAILGGLTVDECRTLAAELASLDAAREPYQRRWERQHAFDCRTDWQFYLQDLVDEWSGAQTHPLADWNRQNDLMGLADLRMLMVNAALHAYLREHGRLPNDLNALVPAYLSSVPLDPWDGAPVRYRRTDGAYCIYCVGWDGVDHGGLVDMYAARGTQHGDMLRFGPRFPPLRRAVKERLTSGATPAWSWLKAAVAAAQETAPPTAD